MTSLATAGAIPAVAGAIAGPVGLAVGLILAFWPDSSKCAKYSPDPETFLKCWSHPIPDDFVPEWDTSKCGWFRWVKCPGAKGGHYPADGCGPCDNPPGGPGYSGGKWTCWQGTEIAPGVQAWGQTGTILGTSASGITNSIVDAIASDPTKAALYGAGGLALAVLVIRRLSR